MTFATSNSEGTVQNLVLEFLELLPGSTQRLVHLSAIPNAIHPELLQKMAGEDVDVAGILDTLQQYYFLNKREGGWYSFSPAIRDFLRTHWQQAGQAYEFQRANQIAIAYFDQLAEQTHPPGNHVFQREALYHRLLADEPAGLETMADLFERVYDQRQIGAAQNFSIQLAQIAPALSPVAAQHATYYELRLDFLLNRRKDLVTSLERLRQETSDPLLKARAGILLGQVLLSAYEWKKAADTLKSSLATLQDLGARRYAARAMLALGDVYVDLVENTGGVQPERTRRFHRWSYFLTVVTLLPFLILEWLKRKIWFVPGWFASTTNYQEWILNYLLQMAGRWYHKAGRMAQLAGDDATSLKALFGQANVAVQQRREAQARRLFSRLRRLSAVHSSDYRRAQVLHGQGQVSLLANRADQASHELENALSIFRSYSDEANMAAVSQTLGRTYLRLTQHEAAATVLLESLQTYRELQDHLSQTQIAGELDQLIENDQIAGSTKQQVRESLGKIQERHYLARFPNDLLQRFRTLAYWIALPLAYILVLVVGALVSQALIAIEDSVLETSITGSLSLEVIVFMLTVGVMPIFLAFWILQLIYALVGQIWIFLAGHNSLNRLGEQPDRVVSTPEALRVDRPGTDEPVQMQWDQIHKLVSGDYRLWKRPIYLLSRLGIVGESKSIILDGITSGYRQLRKEIMQKLGGSVNEIKADLVILAHPSTYAAVFFALLQAQLLVAAGKIDICVWNPTTGWIHLFLSRLLVFFIANMILIFPPLILWRLYLQRRLFEQQLGMPRRGFGNFLRLSVAILLSIVAVVWLIMSLVLETDSGEECESARTIPQTVLLDGWAGVDPSEQANADEQIQPPGGLPHNAPGASGTERVNVSGKVAFISISERQGCRFAGSGSRRWQT